MQLQHRRTRRKRKLPCSRHHVTVRSRLDCQERATLPTPHRRSNLQHIRLHAQHPTNITNEAATEAVYHSVRARTGTLRQIEGTSHTQAECKARLPESPTRPVCCSRISQEIDRLVAADVLSPIDHSDWAPPIVVIQKKNGSIRLCADYERRIRATPAPTSNA
ncbi:hypothetical protein Y032_0079g1260 [Ancylostoma ceylanicum]|uniref:Reverse transcriptase domain-containing protein n=1 Tax=Ancylostoma ceylanicum TaxID=53326 RepID=A0A016TTE8_9BILA|nr:hypothetical protein Y032_0079g1260 [Ancylostoma ceylanicum]